MDRPSGEAPRLALIVAAAGSGRRLGRDVPKALVALAGLPMIAHSLALACSLDDLVLVSIAAPAGHVADVEDIARTVAPQLAVRVVAGGSSRQQSVRRALEAVPPEVDVALCHDAARPFASRSLVERLVDALSVGGRQVAGAVPVLAPVDTVKRIADGLIAGTMARETVALAQTPQAFRAGALRDAHVAVPRDGVKSTDATDDAALVERRGGRVVVVPGDPLNFKITTPEDLERAERLARAVHA